MKPAERDLLHAMLSALVDGTLNERQTAELAALLGSDADARRFYVRYLDMHAALGTAAAVPALASRWRVPWMAIVASLMAASVLLAWLGVPVARRGDLPATADPAMLTKGGAVTAGYVATIRSASGGAVFNGEPAVVGARLTPGRYEITTGVVAVQFDGGARVLFDGPTRFAIQSRRAMAIDHGTFVFEGDQSSEPIEVVTPHSVFRNIGTRYAVVITAQTEEVHVADGAVRRTTEEYSQLPRHELIEAGSGRRYEARKDVAEPIPLDRTLVARVLNEAPAATQESRATVVDFFRGEGDRINGLRSGRGWAGPWRSQRGSLRLVSPGLAGVGSVALLHERSGDDPAGLRSAAHRTLEKPIDLSEDGVWYLRFLVRRSPPAGKDEHRATVVLRTHGLTPQEEVERASLIQIALRRDDAALVRVGDSLTRASLPQVPGECYAVIAKIVSGREKPEQVLICLMAADRLADSEEPNDWSVASESVYTDMRIDQLSLECVSSGRIEFGDLCIGPTWASVIGPAGDR